MTKKEGKKFSSTVHFFKFLFPLRFLLSSRSRQKTNAAPCLLPLKGKFSHRLHGKTKVTGDILNMDITYNCTPFSWMPSLQQDPPDVDCFWAKIPADKTVEERMARNGCVCLFPFLHKTHPSSSKYHHQCRCKHHEIL